MLEKFIDLLFEYVLGAYIWEIEHRRNRIIKAKKEEVWIKGKHKYPLNKIKQTTTNKKFYVFKFITTLLKKKKNCA